MSKAKNPATGVRCGGPLNIKALAGVDVQNPTETSSEFQSELLAVRHVMRRCCVSFWHAKTICRLYGIGGVA